MNTARLSATGLTDSCSSASVHSDSNHLMAPAVALSRYPSAQRASRTERGSGVRHLSADSPVHPAESSSLVLRTEPSPPVALHLASRPRSYFWLRAGERLPGEDLHPSTLEHSQTHWRRLPAAECQETAAGSRCH